MKGDKAVEMPLFSHILFFYLENYSNLSTHIGAVLAVIDKVRELAK